MTDYKQLCAELTDVLDNLSCYYDVPNQSELVERARAALAEPESEGPQPMPVSDAFAVVQRRLDQLASDQELMIYRWPDGDWTIDHTNPERYVQLGESSGRYSSTGGTFWEAVNNLAALLPDHAALAEPRIIRIDRDETGPYILVAEPQLELPTDEELLQIFDAACLSEGGTTDEIHLRGLRAVLARWGNS